MGLRPPLLSSPSPLWMSSASSSFWLCCLLLASALPGSSSWGADVFAVKNVRTRVLSSWLSRYEHHSDTCEWFVKNMAKSISAPAREGVLLALTRLSELRARDLCRYNIMNDQLVSGSWITRIVNAQYMKPFSVPCYTPNRHMPVICMGSAAINASGDLVMTLTTNCTLDPSSHHTLRSAVELGEVNSVSWVKPEKVLASAAIQAMRRACIHLTAAIDNLNITSYTHFNFSLQWGNNSGAFHAAAQWGSDFSYAPLLYAEYLAVHPAMETMPAVVMVAILLTKFASTIQHRLVQ
nr:MAG: putative glycoprotein 1 [Jingmen shrew arterivirus 1]